MTASTGTTVAGLVLCLAAAALLVALAVPIHERARDTAGLRSTLADIRSWDQAFGAYIAARGVAPSNPKGPIIFKKPIVEELAPYMDQFRTLDWWGFNYLVWAGPGNSEYGIRLEGPADYLLVSTGKGGVRETWTYDPARPDAGLYALETAEDYEKDIVIWNGRLVRGPKGAR
jgi:hypothetical protein